MIDYSEAKSTPESDEISEKIADLDKRIAYQEKIHEKVEKDPNMVHGVVKEGLIVIMVSVFATCIGVSLYFMNKSNNN